ncbi:MAG: hypothetical protein WAT79_16170 [Saprospiraceae bacterium]
MKNIFYLVIKLLLIFHISNCVSGKKSINPATEVEPKNIEKINSLDKNDYDKLKIYCGKDSIIVDQKLKQIPPRDIDIYYCLREKAFQGDNEACRHIAIIIPLMRSPFDIYNKKLRGDTLFKVVLKQLHNFEFINTYDGELSYTTFFNFNCHVLVDMIESIDGISIDSYLKLKYKEMWKPEMIELGILSREYIQMDAKMYWEIYKEAYDKGLIKLKDFGQE